MKLFDLGYSLTFTALNINYNKIFTGKTEHPKKLFFFIGKHQISVFLIISTENTKKLFFYPGCPDGLDKVMPLHKDYRLKIFTCDYL